ncbi:TatD DNase family Scn1, partial [Cylindrobasidium torrendii FP15055 ss-10]
MVSSIGWNCCPNSRRQALKPQLPDDTVLRHITDVHCHPTDAAIITDASLQALKINICAMSTRTSDQSLVKDLARRLPENVIPCFGYHPWFTHFVTLQGGVSKNIHYSSLFPSGAPDFPELLDVFPEPRTLSDVLSEVRQSLLEFPQAMLGEVGIDRIFRVPYDYDASPRKLSPFVVPLDHQLAILEAQIDLAVELKRNISLHSVKAPLPTKELLDSMQKKYGDRWNQISIDLHSCGLSPDMWLDIQKHHPNAFLSLSTVINSRSPNHIALIKACEDDRLLVESDYNDIDACTPKTWEMVQIIAETKGWALEQVWEEAVEEKNWGAVRKLERNWQRFAAGNHRGPPQKQATKKKASN